MGGPLFAGDGLSGLSGTKPVWSLEQIVANLTRWDARWGPAQVPYTFYETAPAHLASNSDWSGFVSFSAAQREATRQVLALIAEVANVTFHEVADDGSAPGPANPRLTFSTSLSTAQYFTGYAMVDISEGFDLGDAHDIRSAELMFNAHRWADTTVGERPFLVLIHEILHGLGLPHPGAYNRSPGEEITYGKHAEYAQDSTQFTVMSYFGASATGSKHTVYAQTPLLHDIAALQALYGVNTSTRTGDTVYGYNSNAGRDTFDFDRNGAPIFSIWDAGGTDTLDFSRTAAAVNVDLNPGAFSDAFGMTNNISIAHGAWIENAFGGSAADVLRGNAADNRLDGGGGDDRLEGRGGANRLDGGDGGDTADYSAATQGVTVDLRISAAQETGFGIDTLVSIEHIDGSGFADRLTGNGAANRLEGFGGADVLIGHGGDDILIGGMGDDRLEGGVGADTAVFAYAFANATVNAGGTLVTGAGGADVLSSIERFQFSDGTIDTADGRATVDDLFYFGQRLDVWKAGLDAEAHYDQYGWREGADPNGWFSTRGYLAANADIRALGMNPLQHYEQYGWREGRDTSVSFDVELYLRFNPDVAAAGLNPLAHYLEYGRFEGRTVYRAVGKDVAPDGFDAEFYYLANPDVAAAGLDARAHYDQYGWREGRDPNAWFDSEAYLDAYADVAAISMNPFEHYNQYGWREGRDPSAGLDSSAYLAANPDIVALGLNPLAHFLEYGVYEGRAPQGDGRMDAPGSGAASASEPIRSWYLGSPIEDELDSLPSGAWAERDALPTLPIHRLALEQDGPSALIYDLAVGWLL